MNESNLNEIRNGTERQIRERTKLKIWNAYFIAVVFLYS